MITVEAICGKLFELAPEHMKESWDNVGLLCGHGDRQVHRVLVALDPFYDVAAEAAAWGAELLVTHHPLIFGGIQAVNDRTHAGKTLLYLIEHGIAAVNMHTNLDSAPGGVNDCLAEALGLEDIRVLSPGGEGYGLGRHGMTAPCDLPAFLAQVKAALGCGGLRYADGGREVRHVAVGGGSCGDFIQDVMALGCDTFVTADLKYNMFADAAAMGLNLIDAGHFPTENLVCGVMADYLREAFPELEVRVSQSHGDSVKFG